MPMASTSTSPDLQGENPGRTTPHAGWYQNELTPWIQNQDSKKLVGYGIGMFLLAGKFNIILTDFIFTYFLSCFQELLFFCAWESANTKSKFKNAWWREFFFDIAYTQQIKYTHFILLFYNILSDCQMSDEINYLLNAFRLDKKKLIYIG